MTKRDKRKGFRAGYKKLGPIGRFLVIFTIVGFFISVVITLIIFAIQAKYGASKILQKQAQKNIEIIREAVTKKEPNFNQNMLAMITGIPAIIFKNYQEALDFFELKDYKNAEEKIELAISSYESYDDWDLKKFSAKEHYEQVSNFYILAAKTSTQVGKHSKAYEYSKKALKAKTSYYTYYSFSVAAYNVKNYKESLESVNKAIELTPPEPKYKEIKEQYQQIKEKCLSHLGIKN